MQRCLAGVQEAAELLVVAEAAPGQEGRDRAPEAGERRRLRKWLRQQPFEARRDHPAMVAATRLPGTYRTVIGGVSEPPDGPCGGGQRTRLAFRVPLVPGGEQLAGVEDRRVGPADDADQQRQGEGADRGRPEQEQGGQRHHHRQAGVDRSTERLQDRVVDDRAERLAGVAHPVLPDPVEDDDRVVDREADDGQQRGHEQGVELEPEEEAEHREDPDHDDHVVQERDDRRGPVPEPEADPQVGEDEELADDDQDDRAPDQLRPDRRPDRGDAARHAVAEASDQLPLQVVERRAGDHRRRGRAGRGAGARRGRRRAARLWRRRWAGRGAWARRGRDS